MFKEIEYITKQELYEILEKTEYKSDYQNKWISLKDLKRRLETK